LHPVTKTAVILFLFFSAKLYGQSNDHVISGTIHDKQSKQPVEFASIELLKTDDSSVVASTVTDRKGRFLLDKVANGRFVLHCSFIGYEKKLLPIEVIQKKQNIGVIEIGSVAKDLGEVTVTSRQSLLNTSIDRKVYNVAQDIMAQSGSASDILKNIPSVEVDLEGSVSLRGSTDVLILINGRPSPLMGRTRAEVLQQLPANSIERIEVITNPSARYRPDGTSGIINIVLKKNLKGGWNGTIVANAGSNGRYNGNISLNYNPGKLNFFATYGIRRDRRFRTNTINREYLDSMGKISGYYDEYSESIGRPLSQFVNGGIDIRANAQNSFGLSGNLFFRDMTRRDLVQRWFYDQSRLLTGRFDRRRHDTEPEWERDATAYWQHNFPKEDHQLRAEFTTSSSQDQENNLYTNNFHRPALASSLDNTIVTEGDKQQQATVEYSNPLTENSKLEAGYMGSFNQIDLDFYVGYYDGLRRIFLKDLNRTNRFLYKEKIHAVYATYQRSYEKFGYSAGLRAEQAYIDGDLVTKDSSINNRYFMIYPTLHLSYKLNNGELQLNYSKRVNRPDGDEMNPFPEYQDPYNLRAGNPKLLPEIIHSIEFGYKWQNQKFSFVPSLYYRYKQNGFTSVTIPLNDTVLLTTEQNLSNDQSAGLELIFSAKAGDFFSANLNTNFFYNQIDASDLGYSSRKSIYAMNSNFNSSFTLSKTTMLQVNCNYRSARLTPQGKSYSSFVLNAGLRQDLFKKKFSLILTASDILKTMRFKNELNTSDLRQVSYSRRDARVIHFGISYRFGKTIKKPAEEKLEFDNNLN
jgi:outer membrane receptor protein involved in Fe transport